MTLDEAHTEAVCGSRMTAAHLPVGVCLVYDSSYNWNRFRRVWPNGDGCEFVPSAEDYSADWYELEAPAVEPVAPNVGFVHGKGVGVPSPAKADAWGRPNAPEYVAAVDKLIGGWGKPKVAPVEYVRDKWGKPI